jgi:hypothetical protein
MNELPNNVVRETHVDMKYMKQRWAEAYGMIVLSLAAFLGAILVETGGTTVLMKLLNIRFFGGIIVIYVLLLPVTVLICMYLASISFRASQYKQCLRRLNISTYACFPLIFVGCFILLGLIGALI